jgi:hypothetical protein
VLAPVFTDEEQALLDGLLAIVADPAVPDEEVGGLIRGEKVGWERLRSAQSTALPPLPRDHGHLAALDGSYGYLRQFTPQVLEAVTFAGGTAATDLRRVDDEVLAHISPAHSENINFFGSIDVHVDIEGELAQLGPPATGPCASATPSSESRPGPERVR